MLLLDHCPRCGGASLVLNGCVRGKPRKKCKDCGCQFTRLTSRGASQKIKFFAVLLYLNGTSLNQAARLCGVSAQSVLKWARELASQPNKDPSMHLKLEHSRLDMLDQEFQKGSLAVPTLARSQLLVLIDLDAVQIKRLIKIV